MSGRDSLRAFAPFTGPNAWPDHVLSYDVATLLTGLIFQVRGYAVGFELHGRRDWNPWLGLYLGPWAFEVYFDADRSFEEENEDESGLLSFVPGGSTLLADELLPEEDGPDPGEEPIPCYDAEPHGPHHWVDGIVRWCDGHEDPAR